MKTLNQIICDYTCYLQQGEIQLVYRGILEFLGKLRVDFIQKYPHYTVGAYTKVIWICHIFLLTRNT